MGIIYRLALVLVIIGAINWGLIGFFQFDLVATLFGGQDALLSRIVYSLVGISGLIAIPLLFKDYEDAAEYGNSYSNMNYQTEFGEDFDLTEEEKKNAVEPYKKGKGNRNDDDENYLI